MVVIVTKKSITRNLSKDVYNALLKNQYLLS